MPGPFRSFLKDARGVTALTFGLTLPALALAVGGGIDFSRAAARHQRMASAIELACQQAVQEIRYQGSQAEADPKKDYGPARQGPRGEEDRGRRPGRGDGSRNHCW